MRDVARHRTCLRSRCIARSSPPPHRRSSEVVVDVVVVGAGIVGLLTARALLQRRLAVALVERKQLCAGATGAGQGYIWMAHRSPSTAVWDLAAASVAEWRAMVQQQPELRDCIEWQDTGSMLVATSEEEAAALRARQALLSQQGVTALYLSSEQALEWEPALVGAAGRRGGRRRQGLVEGSGGGGGGVEVQGALVTASDAQINGRQTAHTLLSLCKAHAGLTLLTDEPVERLLTQHETGNSACATGVETQGRTIGARLGTVVAAGVWSGGLLAQATGEPRWKATLQPRRGHLLELPRPEGMPALKAGIMEMSYTKHYSTERQTAQHKQQDQQQQQQQQQQQRQGQRHEQDSAPVDITFTATTSASGSLLVGSSREFSGMDAQASPAIVQAIMQRAALFLPDLAGVPLPQGPDVRVGLRPFATGGTPMIGPVPGSPGLYVAAGHEGSGLCLGPATASLVCEHLLGDGATTSALRYRELLPRLLSA